MARKEATVIIDTPGRDAGKHFELREMSAVQAERWATRALLALLRSGVEVPEDIASAGLAGVAAMGIRAFGGINYADAEPLLAEMMGCCAYIPNPSQPNVKLTGLSMEGQIEEVTTLLRLREEVISLHVNFSIKDYRLKLMAPSQTVGTTPNTGT